MMNTPELVAAIRVETRQSQEELAREIGVSFASVNAWENGRTEPRPMYRALLEKRAIELGVLNHTLVLVIDDEPDACQLAEAVVRRVAPDVDVVSATNGSRGLLLCGRLTPDVLLLDVRMPDIDGIEVARALARVEGLEHVAVYFLTGQPPTDMADIAASVGASGVIRKPLERQDVEDILAALPRASVRS